MKKKLVIIGANDFQNPLILRAKAMGYSTHVFAWQSGDIGERTADYFYPISIVEKERILEICQKLKPEGITSIGSDLAAIAVNYVAEAMQLTGNSMESTKKSTNKHLMRRAFEQAQLPSCKSILADETLDLTALEMKYPLIVKPTDRSGSRGIFKVTEPSQLAGALAQAKEPSFEKKALIEEFAEGREYSIEYISYRGEHHFLACTEKFTTGAPLFVETGHVEPPLHMEEETLQRIKELVPRILDCLEVKYGASHTELKVDKDGSIRIIECGARMGGDNIGSDLVQMSTGVDFVGACINIACGKEPCLEKCSEPCIAAIRFIFNEEDLRRMEQICKDQPESIQRVSEILPIDGRTISDSSTRYGYYILRAEDADTMRKLLIQSGLEVD